MIPTYIDLTSSDKTPSLIINEMYDDVAIQNSLYNIFSTPLGSLPGKPYFGTQIHQMLFNFIDGITEEIMREIILSEIAKFEPRITVSSIQFDNYPEYNSMNIIVNYFYSNKEMQVQGSATVTIKL